MNDPLLILCSCGHPTHQLIVRKDPLGEDYYFITVHLARLSLLKRIGYAVKYVFGYRSEWGAFEEVMLIGDDFRAAFNKINSL